MRTRASLSMLGLAAISLGQACARVEPAVETPAQSASSSPSLSVVLSRSACYGTCPVYTVTASRAGTVVFEGERHVRQIGRATASVAPDSVAALAAELERAGFQGMAERYAFGEAACGLYASDLPTLTLTLVRDGRTKRVEYDQGCQGAPATLASLARRIDEVAGSARWVAVP